MTKEALDDDSLRMEYIGQADCAWAATEYYWEGDCAGAATEYHWAGGLRLGRMEHARY